MLLMPERDARQQREEGFLLSRDLCPPSSRCLICEEFSAAACFYPYSTQLSDAGEGFSYQNHHDGSTAI